jgi:hypothetical protein
LNNLSTMHDNGFACIRALFPGCPGNLLNGLPVAERFSANRRGQPQRAGVSYPSGFIVGVGVGIGIGIEG